jgi:hypothetical protein
LILFELGVRRWMPGAGGMDAAAAIAAGGATGARPAFPTRIGEEAGIAATALRATRGADGKQTALRATRGAEGE